LEDSSDTRCISALYLSSPGTRAISTVEPFEKLTTAALEIELVAKTASLCAKVTAKTKLTHKRG
jgi:hypothetical protein